MASSAQQDDWSTKEKFILACCVSRSGDQNWVSVGRTMRLILESSCEEGLKRPPEWFSQKNFAVNYNQLLNTATVSKRKVRGATSESGNVETPAEQILRKLTFERIEELDRAIKTERERYKKLKKDIQKIQNGKLDDELPRILQAIQSGQDVPLEQLIKDDLPEELSVKTSSQSTNVTSSPASQTTPSRPQRVTKETEKFKSYIEQRQKHNAKYHHNATTAPTSTISTTSIDVSPSSTITTSTDLSLLATTVGPSPAQVQNMTARYDTVGSIAQSRGLLITKPDQRQQQQQQEQQISSLTGPTTPVRTAVTENKEKSFLSNLLSSPASEIKAQVQHINETLKEPVKHPHHVTKESYEAYKKAQQPDTKGVGMKTAPMLSKLLEGSNAPVPSNVKLPAPQLSVKPPPSKLLPSEPVKTFTPKSEPTQPTTSTSEPPSPTSQPQVTTPKVTTPKVTAELSESEATPKLDATISPVTPRENKPVHDTKIPAEIKVTVASIPKAKVAPLNEPINSKSSKRKLSDAKADEKKDAVKIEPVLEETPAVATKNIILDEEADEKVVKDVGKKVRTVSKTEPLSIEVNETALIKNEPISVDSTPEEPPTKKRMSEQADDTPTADISSEHLELSLVSSSPKLKKKGKGRAARTGRKKTLSGSMKIDVVSEEDLDRTEETESDLKESELDTTDDSIDRKIKTPLTPSLPSPASPALSTGSNCDPETAQQQRAWRKSIMLVWKAAASHKYANVFLHPVTDEEAPGYSSIIYRPMDLSLIKKNIETGVIHTTTEFQRDIMLMFQNALMYNRKEHDVYRMAQEMRDDVMEQIQSFISTQLMVQTTERDSKVLRGKNDAPGHTRQSSKSGFTFLSL